MLVLVFATAVAGGFVALIIHDRWVEYKASQQQIAKRLRKAKKLTTTNDPDGFLD